MTAQMVHDGFTATVSPIGVENDDLVKLLRREDSRLSTSSHSRTQERASDLEYASELIRDILVLEIETCARTNFLCRRLETTCKGNYFPSFIAFDNDADGFISCNDFRTSFTRESEACGIECAGELKCIDRVVSSFDEDGDGSLGFVDWVSTYLLHIAVVFLFFIFFSSSSLHVSLPFSLLLPSTCDIYTLTFSFSELVLLLVCTMPDAYIYPL